MAVMLRSSRASALGGILPTATPDQPGVKDGISREAGSWNSCGSFVGAMPGPGGLFVGMIVSPMGLFVGSNAQPWGAGFLGDACPHGAGFGADAQARCWSTQSTGKNAIVFLTPKISPASKPRHLSTPFSPTSPLGHPVGGAELPGSHPSCLHQASLLSLRGCEAGEAGAGTHCPNLPRLVLFQQDFQVPAVPAEPRRVGLGRAAASPARAGLAARPRFSRVQGMGPRGARGHSPQGSGARRVPVLQGWR